MLVGPEMTAAKGSTTKSDSPRHFLCLKGIISMDFSKGAIFVCHLGRCAEISGGGGGRADGTGFTVLPGLMAKSPWVEVSKLQQAAPTTTVL